MSWGTISARRGASSGFATGAIVALSVWAALLAVLLIVDSIGQVWPRWAEDPVPKAIAALFRMLVAPTLFLNGSVAGGNPADPPFTDSVAVHAALSAMLYAIFGAAIAEVFVRFGRRRSAAA